MSQEIQLPPDDLIRRTRGDVAFVVNFSGGKDSMRMLGQVRELYPNYPIFVVMADTGFEHVRPISGEDWSRKQAARFDLPLTVVRNPNKTYLQMVERRGMQEASWRDCGSGFLQTQSLRPSASCVVCRLAATRIRDACPCNKRP